jgi:3-hydroxyisobutyrate dehydrogenase-like beta-hydroxyacid dehydrogenase
MLINKNFMGDTMKIGFIGLGTMGKGMVVNLLKNNHEVIAYNREKTKGESIENLNFSMVDYPKEICSKAELIFICVSDDKAVEHVLLGNDGLFETLSSKNILVDCSTISIELTGKIADECKKRNVVFLDAPVTGSKLGAENGNLMFMVGGDKKTLDNLNHVFMCMGKRIVYCGKNGSGQKAKLALNLTQAMILESYYEGLGLAIKNGIPINSMLEILDNSAAKNGVSSFKMPYILKSEFDAHFKLSLMKKDLLLAKSEIKKLKMNLPLAKKIFEVYEDASKIDLDNEDFCSTVKVLERKNNIKIQ